MRVGHDVQIELPQSSQVKRGGLISQRRLLAGMLFVVPFILLRCQSVPHTSVKKSDSAPIPQETAQLVGSWEHTADTASITLSFSPDGRFHERQRYAGHTVESQGVYLVYTLETSKLKIMRFIETFTPSDVIHIPLRDAFTITWQDAHTLQTPYGVFRRRQEP